MLILVAFIMLWGSALAWAGVSTLLQQTLQSPPSWVKPGAWMDMDFAHQRYWIGGRIATPQQLTVTRASNQTCTSVAGSITYVGSNTPCITDNGLQVWGGATNLLLQSAINTTNTNWAATRATLTGAAATSSDGTANAATLIEDLSNNTHFNVQSVTKAASALPYTFSVYGSNASTRRIAIQADDGAGNGVIAPCNLSTQAIGSAAGVGTPFTSISATKLAFPNGWTRCSVVFTTNTATTLRAVIFLDNGSGTAVASTSYQGDNTSGATIWAAQLEQNTYLSPSPYTPTTTAPAATAVDVVNYTLPTNIGMPTPGYAVYAEGVSQVQPAYGTAQVFVILSDGSTNNRLQCGKTAALGTWQTALIAGAATQWSVTGGGTLVQYALGSKCAASISSGIQTGAGNGTALTAGTSATLPASLTTVSFGIRADNSALTAWHGYVARAAIFLQDIAGQVTNLTK